MRRINIKIMGTKGRNAFPLKSFIGATLNFLTKGRKTFHGQEMFFVVVDQYHYVKKCDVKSEKQVRPSRKKNVFVLVSLDAIKGRCHNRVWSVVRQFALCELDMALT